MAGAIRIEHMRAMKDGAILANSGHFDVEVDVAALRAHAVASAPIRDNMVEFRLADGRALYLLAEAQRRMTELSTRK